jgi:hypothetical protein
VIINALPDAPAAVQAPHVVCGEGLTVRPASPQDTGMIGAYIRALFFASRRNRFLGSVNEISANDTLVRITKRLCVLDGAQARNEVLSQAWSIAA